MCQWGDTVKMEVTIPARLSHSGKEYIKLADIDRCIAPLVKALNDAGFVTTASCCGHGHRPGDIALADGRELIICLDYESARKIDKVFPDIHGEWRPAN